MAVLDETTNPYKSAYLNSMGQHSGASTKVTINRKVIPFKLDTGVEITAISEEALQKIGNPILKKPSVVWTRSLYI